MYIFEISCLSVASFGYPPEECGMNGCCNCYFVVEGNGDIYPCDFYCTDEWKLGKVGDSFQHMYEDALAQRFVERSKELHEKCKQCPYLSLCRGGCCRWRESEGQAGLHKLCRSYEIFFEHTQERLHKLGKYILTRDLQVLQ